MKKNDYAALVLIAGLSLLVAWFVASSIIGEPKKEAQKVKTLDAISSTVETPSNKIFNKKAINPTVERSIGKSSDSLPF
ncbi:MAG: hypothetical protein Q7T74_06295 [Candidatus Saccharibacteria bacterium]|nr:hypothetical protein [Candidatus Saccharibacteria bacterium]